MRHLDQCDNGCYAPAVKWTSQGYVCLRCAYALDREEERYRRPCDADMKERMRERWSALDKDSDLA